MRQWGGRRAGRGGAWAWDAGDAAAGAAGAVAALGFTSVGVQGRARIWPWACGVVGRGVGPPWAGGGGGWWRRLAAGWARGMGVRGVRGGGGAAVRAGRAGPGVGVGWTGVWYGQAASRLSWHARVYGFVICALRAPEETVRSCLVWRHDVVADVFRKLGFAVCGLAGLAPGLAWGLAWGLAGAARLAACRGCAVVWAWVGVFARAWSAHGWSGVCGCLGVGACGPVCCLAFRVVTLLLLH